MLSVPFAEAPANGDRKEGNSIPLCQNCNDRALSAAPDPTWALSCNPTNHSTRIEFIHCPCELSTAVTCAAPAARQTNGG